MKDILETIKDLLGSIIWLFTIVVVIYIGEFLLKLVYPKYDGDNLILLLSFTAFLAVIIILIYVNFIEDYIKGYKKGAKNWVIKEKKMKENREKLNNGEITKEEHEKTRLEILSKYTIKRKK